MWERCTLTKRIRNSEGDTGCTMRELGKTMGPAGPIIRRLKMDSNLIFWTRLLMINHHHHHWRRRRPSGGCGSDRKEIGDGQNISSYTARCDIGWLYARRCPFFTFFFLLDMQPGSYMYVWILKDSNLKRLLGLVLPAPTSLASNVVCTVYYLSSTSLNYI